MADEQNLYGVADAANRVVDAVEMVEATTIADAVYELGEALESAGLRCPCDEIGYPDRPVLARVAAGVLAGAAALTVAVTLVLGETGAAALVLLLVAFGCYVLSLEGGES